MPIYEYVCDACGNQSEEFQKITSDPLTHCVACGEPKYRRVPSVPHSDLIEFHKPIEMYSIAMEDPEQIKQFITKTGVHVSLNPSDPLYGVPIARNRSDKRKALQDAGFEEK